MLTHSLPIPLRAALDALPQQIAILSQDGVIVQMNKAWARAVRGDTPIHAKLGTNYLTACHAQADTHRREVCSEIYRGLSSILSGEGEPFTLEYAYPTKTDTKWFVMHIQPLDKRVGGAVISHIDVSHHKRFEQEMKRMAYSDALTGLPNRHAFFEQAKQMIASAERRGLELTLLYIDLDGFKRVNDTLGHDVGDALLVAIAERLKRQTRESDLLARLGGDEFSCLLEVAEDGGESGSGESGDGAAQVAARYAACLDNPFKLADEEVQMGASIGVAHFPQDGSTLRTLLKRADGAMYSHKRRAAGHRTSFERLRPASG